MGKNWKEVKFSEVVYLRHGHQFRKYDFVKSGIPVVKIGQCKANGTLDLSKCDYIDSNRIDEFEDYRIEKGDILMALTGGTLGKVTEVNKDYGVAVQNYRVGNFFPKKDITKAFIKLILLSNIFQDLVASKVNQGAQPNIGKDNIDNMIIPLPSLPEQQRIVTKLDGLFAKIDQAIGLLEENIKHTQALMGSVLDEELTLLAKQYSITKVKDVVKLSRGHNPTKKEFIYEPKEGYIRFLQIRDGSSDKNACYVPITKKLHLVNKADLLLVAYRHVGKVFREMEGAFNVALCKLENLDGSKLNMTYMYYLVKSKYIKGELLKRSERALIPSMSVDHLKSLEIPFPDIAKQNEVVIKLEKASELSKESLEIQTQKLNHLIALKSSLLDQAFKGEL